MKKSVSKFGILAVVVFSFLLICLITPDTRAQFYELELSITDTTAYSGEQTTISIHLKNYFDTVAAFEFWLLLEHPEIAEFVTQGDTIIDTTYWKCTNWNGPDCIDSLDYTYEVLSLGSTDYDWIIENEYQRTTGTIDTSGTLCSGWDQISAVSIGGQGYDLKVCGMANFGLQPPYISGILPQNSEIPLLKIPLQIYDIPDNQTDRTVGIYFQADNLDHFAFSDPRGNSIGVGVDSVPDTSWYNCMNWDEDSTFCFFWEEVPDGPADSFYCCDTFIYATISPEVVNISHGALTVAGPPACGDFNGDGNINIIDVTAIISYLYQGGQPPAFPNSVDVDSSGVINLLDVTYLINYLYGDGPEPNCA